jgi:hypothetical protein
MEWSKSYCEGSHAYVVYIICCLHSILMVYVHGRKISLLWRK